MNLYHFIYLLSVDPHQNRTHIGIGHKGCSVYDFSIDILGLYGASDDLGLCAQTIILCQIDGLIGIAQIQYDHIQIAACLLPAR